MSWSALLLPRSRHTASLHSRASPGITEHVLVCLAAAAKPALQVCTAVRLRASQSTSWSVLLLPRSRHTASLHSRASPDVTEHVLVCLAAAAKPALQVCTAVRLRTSQSTSWSVLLLPRSRHCKSAQPCVSGRHRARPGLSCCCREAGTASLHSRASPDVPQSRTGVQS